MMMIYMNFMRERAMMTMFSFGTGSQIMVFHPNVLDLNFIMDSLGFMKYNRDQFSTEEDSADIELDAALLMIRKLKTSVAVEGSVKEESQEVVPDTSSVKEEVQEVGAAVEGGDSMT